MANDATWPGPNNTYPFWPRDLDGIPKPVGGMEAHRTAAGEKIMIDSRSYTPDGRLIQEVAPQMVRGPGNGIAKLTEWAAGGYRVETYTATAPNGEVLTITRNVDTGETAIH